jgi:hypothetical protein
MYDGQLDLVVVDRLDVEGHLGTPLCRGLFDDVRVESEGGQLRNEGVERERESAVGVRFEDDLFWMLDPKVAVLPYVGRALLPVRCHGVSHVAV